MPAHPRQIASAPSSSTAARAATTISRLAASGSRSQSSTVNGVVRIDAQRVSSPCSLTMSSSIGFTRGSTLTIVKRWATVQAMSIEASAMPTTGTGEISRAANSPGSP